MYSFRGGGLMSRRRAATTQTQNSCALNIFQYGIEASKACEKGISEGSFTKSHPQNLNSEQCRFPHTFSRVNFSIFLNHSSDLSTPSKQSGLLVRLGVE